MFLCVLNSFTSIFLMQIELHPPPVGEGSSYEVSFKNLRPSLDWCLDNGWTVPIPEVFSLFYCFLTFK